jgi:Flp pilus assembly protein TadG
MRRLRDFASDRRGVSALEFAFVAPVLITLYLGLAELTSAMTAARRVSHVASALGDLTAQRNEVTTADMSNIFAASTAILAPYPTTPLKARISSVTIDSKGAAKVDWSSAKNWTPFAANAAVTIPSGIVTAGQSAVMAEVSYAYASPIDLLMPQGVTFSRTFYLRPRRVSKVEKIS